MLPPDLTLEGRIVRLVPLDPDRDAAALFACTPPETFRWFMKWPVEWTPSAFDAYIRDLHAMPRARPFTVIDRATGRVVGTTSYLDLDPVNKAIEIGFTWYAGEARGTGINPECKLLLLSYAIETLGCVRVTLKTDARNAHSRAAISKLGAPFEGILRAHRIRQDGTTRDTAYFSVLPADWPAVKAGLEKRVEAALLRSAP